LIYNLCIGIGVDYGIYIFSRLESFLNEGYSLAKAYQQTLRTTGTAVFFTGVAQGAFGIVALVAGIVMLGTAAIGWCPPYSLLGINTCGVKQDPKPSV